MSKPRVWTIYGAAYQHPNGYPINKITTLEFESGPDLEIDFKLKVIEKSAYDRAIEALKKSKETIEDLEISLVKHRLYVLKILQVLGEIDE